jgi:hypothetical protein
MAKDEVEVKGGGDFDGAILKNAATEATLSRLADAMEAKQKGLGQKVLGIATSAINQNVKAQQQSTTALQSAQKTLSKLDKAGSDVADTFAKIIGMGLGTTFSLISTAGSGLLEFLKNGFTAFQETAQVGAAFNNNLLDLRIAAANALIPLDEFKELIMQNSLSLAALGGTVTDGAKEFSMLSRQFKDEFGPGLIGAGYSLKQMNEGLMAYLDLQNRTGRLDLRNTKAITQGTNDYMQELDKVTKLTGMSRKAAEEAAKKASLDPILNSMMKHAKDQNKAAANIAMLTQVGGDQALEMIKSMASRNPTDEARMLMATVGTSMEEARDILTGALGPETTVTKMKEYADRLEAQGMLSDEYAEAIAAHNPAMANLIKTLLPFQQLKPEAAAKMIQEQKARDAITTAFGKIAAAFNNIYNKFLIRITESKTFQAFYQKLENMAQAFDDNAESIERFVDLLVSTVTGAFDNFLVNVDQNGIISAIVSFFKDLFSGLKDKIFPSANDLIKDLFKSPEQRKKEEQARTLNRDLNKFTPEERRRFGMPEPTAEQKPTTKKEDFDFDILGNIGAGIKAITGLLPSLSDLGWWLGITGIGGAVGGIGLSVGLGALASGLAEIAVPALAVGAAIGMGMGGLGYAFNGLSNIINAVSDSFTKIKDFFVGVSAIDSTKLSAVGDGMKPISEALVDLGKGSILALIGGGGLTNLATSITAFGNVNADNLAATGPALKSLHDGLAVFTDGGILGNIGESISSWFTGGTIDNVVAALANLGSINLNNLANFGALTGFFTSLKTFSDANASERIPETVNAIKESINNLNIDQGKLENLTSVVGSIKTTFDTDLTSSTNNVNSFTDSINKLVESLSNLENQMKKTPTIGEKVGGAPTIDNNSTYITGAPTISPEESQRQLNMKFDQMIEILTDMRDNTKDAADSLGKRRNAL